MGVIYNNKENLPERLEVQNFPIGSRNRNLGNSLSSSTKNDFNFISQKKNSLRNANKQSLEDPPSHKAKSTAIMSRTMQCQLSVQKYADLGDFNNFSSLKKSQRSDIINQNLGSLIFETPPKGKENRNYLSLKLDEANKLFD